MKKLHTHHVAPIELVKPSFYGMLIFYYCGLATYGAVAFAFLSPTLVSVGGDHFAIIWSGLTGISAIVAVLGVVFSRTLFNGWIEFFSTITLFSLLIGYAVALLIRGITIPGAEGSLAVALLPLDLSVMPIWRIMVMAMDGSVVFRSWKRRRLAELKEQYGE